ncbi:energy transducer TonB [Aquimarina sp. 2201CG5-10]|uniref:energy transducer TonB n=1 Tax=Aquimarina callyspongiae TaxID=3098150 RepID=UPI002AB4D492|nr:energy transducer TonB [Aquimarina sp. 2201CG5-10]MDY8136701.1 energy transducer TonB [Aquimarina sp. 2201CG5-10]
MSNKHDANVRKSTLVNFQIGLVASLLFTYIMFEVYTTTQEISDQPPVVDIYEDPVFTMGDFEIEKEPVKELAVKTEPQKEPDLSDPEIVDDDTALKDIENEYENKTKPTTSAPVSLDDIDDIPEDDEPKEFSFISVEAVPVFPGCEKLETNKEKAACFSEKIRKIVSKKFNTGLGERYGLTGEQRIYTVFDVGADGKIQNIQVRAPHPKLKKEAERVIGLFPEMTPGKQRGTPVRVKYQLPIKFKIEN